MNERIKNWQTQLENTAEALKDSESIDLNKFQALKTELHGIFNYLETNYNHLSNEALKQKQVEFRTNTDHIFKQSYLFSRAREWQRGYPGDYETLEQNYLGMPLTSKGIGMYLDNYFLTGTLARGVRERKELLSSLIIKELKNRTKGQKVLNIGCGSSREIFDIGKQINEYAPQITFFDYDEAAIEYSKLLLFNAEIDISQFQFLKYNALKLASVERTETKFGKKDIIYSAGLFDYVQTDGLKKIIHSLYNLLDEGGVLIAPFKDKEKYRIVDYHWFADWSYFYQRSIEDVKNLLEEATETKVEILKSGSPAINFFILRK